MQTPSPQALCLHPDNPHIFLFREKPAILVGAGEHYAAVLNLDFDFIAYLDTIHTEKLNHTRLFAGVYRERVDEWWPGNPLGPQPGRFACPFARSDVPGARDGGLKFDLGRRDEVFFTRLREFLAAASEREIVVEVNLFCPYYVSVTPREYGRWNLSPWHADNNVNGLGEINPLEIYTLKYPGLLRYEEQMVEWVVRECNPYDNLYFEICNEPYFDGPTLAWQRHISGLITSIERTLPVQHLISQNIANIWARVENPDPNVSIFNFHYPKEHARCVRGNYDLGLPIGCNETGFDGPADEPYRIQAWEFMLSGGGLFSHLDPTFSAEDETGSRRPVEINFGGGPELRRQLAILRGFLESFDLTRLRPADDLVESSPGAEAIHLLTDRNGQAAIYLLVNQGETCDSLSLVLPDGSYEIQWFDTRHGDLGEPVTVEAKNGRLQLIPPLFNVDIAARLRRNSR